MANLGKTAAQWDRFAGDELAGIFLALLRNEREAFDRATLSREQAHVSVFPSAYVDQATSPMVTTTGVNFGVNTHRSGALFVRITGGPTFTVSWYKATGGGGGDLVAQGTGAASTTVALTAQNSSGLTGQWRLPASVSTTTDDLLRIFAVVDWSERVRRTLDGDSTKDPDTLNLVLDLVGRLAARVQANKADVVGTLAAWAIALGQRGPDFTGSTFGALVTDQARDDGDGNVSRFRSGFLPFLKQAMIDEATGGEQDVLRRVVSAAAATFDSTNDGQGTIASHTPQEHCPPGTLTLECVRGYDTGDLGSEEFAGRFKVADRDEQFDVTGVRVARSFSGPRGLGPFMLVRTLTKTDAGSRFTAASTASVSGESNDNTDNGVLYASVVANASNWDISFFRASTRLAGDLVAKATNIATSATFTAVAQNASGLQVAWQLSGTVAADATPSLDLNPFAVENVGAGGPDRVYIAVTETSSGLIQRTLSEEANFHLNSDTSGSESIEDDYMRAGTFPGFAVEDN